MGELAAAERGNGVVKAGRAGERGYHQPACMSQNTKSERGRTVPENAPRAVAGDTIVALEPEGTEKRLCGAAHEGGSGA